MRILLAVDGSDASEQAVRSVAARPWPEGSKVRVLSVAQNLYPLAPEVAAMGPSYEQMTAALVEEAQKLVLRLERDLTSSAATPGLGVETCVRRGDPRAEIVDEAVAWGADLVVLGSHGRTGLKRWVVGSVAEYVVRHAPCSVEVARAAQERTGVRPVAVGSVP